MTNILSTIGPTTENIINLKKILRHTKFVRLNGAHNNLEWHKKICNSVKKINPDCKILIDIPGIKPINIVIKLVQCNGRPVAKISDSPGKTICQDRFFVKSLKKAFHVPLLNEDI